MIARMMRIVQSMSGPYPVTLGGKPIVSKSARHDAPCKVALA
jgi:hypothetical protein